MASYILALDQSTSATKAYLFGTGGVHAEYSLAHSQQYPAPGHVEFDANQVFQNALECIAGVIERGQIDKTEILGLAITNQRESAVLWRRDTGEAACSALSWQDRRAEAFCAEIAEHADLIRERSGLELSASFSAAKFQWMIDHLADGQTLAESGALCVGTIDAYLIYRLTGGQRFACDLSNASRTQLFSLELLDWDPELVRLFGIPRICLPEAAASDGDFGVVAVGAAKGVPILSAMGDSQASLYSLGCFKPGDVKVTYGTGSSVMMQCGEAPLMANGLAASVAWKLSGRAQYVLEGNITHSGDTLVWLRDELKLFGSMDEVERAALAVENNGGVYLVPALTGLGAPYDCPDARALFTGMSRGTRREHLIRAGMESIAYQVASVVELMSDALRIPVRQLNTDGGGISNRTQMQFQADMAGCPVMTSGLSAGSPLGVAIVAGVKAGLYKNHEEAVSIWSPGEVFVPQMESAMRNQLMNGWQAAVRRACMPV